MLNNLRPDSVLTSVDAQKCTSDVQLRAGNPCTIHNGTDVPPNPELPWNEGDTFNPYVTALTLHGSLNMGTKIRYPLESQRPPPILPPDPSRLETFDRYRWGSLINHLPFRQFNFNVIRADCGVISDPNDPDEIAPLPGASFQGLFDPVTHNWLCGPRRFQILFPPQPDVPVPDVDSKEEVPPSGLNAVCICKGPFKMPVNNGGFWLPGSDNQSKSLVTDAMMFGTIEWGFHVPAPGTYENEFDFDIQYSGDPTNTTTDGLWADVWSTLFLVNRKKPAPGDPGDDYQICPLSECDKVCQRVHYQAHRVLTQATDTEVSEPQPFNKGAFWTPVHLKFIYSYQGGLDTPEERARGREVTLRQRIDRALSDVNDIGGDPAFPPVLPAPNFPYPIFCAVNALRVSIKQVGSQTLFVGGETINNMPYPVPAESWLNGVVGENDVPGANGGPPTYQPPPQ